MKAMKKICVMILAAGLFLSAVQGIAAPKDSTWLSSESVMTSTIDQATDGQPIGMISIWATAQAIPDGWLECNGQAVDATKYPEYVAKFGATTPDYRGFFLRGYGGKSGALGVAQDYAVQTNGKDAVNLYGLAIDNIDYVDGVSYTSPSVTLNNSGSKKLSGKIVEALGKINDKVFALETHVSDENLYKTFEEYSKLYGKVNDVTISGSLTNSDFNYNVFGINNMKLKSSNDSDCSSSNISSKSVSFDVTNNDYNVKEYNKYLKSIGVTVDKNLLSFVDYIKIKQNNGMNFNIISLGDNVYKVCGTVQQIENYANYYADYSNKYIKGKLLNFDDYVNIYGKPGSCSYKDTLGNGYVGSYLSAIGINDCKQYSQTSQIGIDCSKAGDGGEKLYGSSYNFANNIYNINSYKKYLESKGVDLSKLDELYIDFSNFIKVRQDLSMIDFNLVISGDILKSCGGIVRYDTYADAYMTYIKNIYNYIPSEKTTVFLFDPNTDEISRNINQLNNELANDTYKDTVSITSGGVSYTTAKQGTVITKVDNNIDNLKIEITSDAGETRPVNKAVRYIVKVE